MNVTGRLTRFTAAIFAAVILSPGGANAQEAQGSAKAEPEFKPGIPGVKMEDVRDHKFLWYEIDELQKWERTNRISVAEYRNKAIEKTVHYLQLEDDTANRFTSVAADSIAAVRESFKRRPPVGEDRAAFSADLNAEVGRMNAVLGDAPRHQLFEPEIKKWLLKLAFGPKERKESMEAKQQAQADTSGR